MSSVGRVQIPLRHYPAFLTLITLSDEQFQELVMTLSRDQKSFSTSAVGSIVTEILGIDPQQADNLAETLVSLHGLRRELQLSSVDMSQALISGLEVARDERLHPTEETRQPVQDRLVEIFEVGGTIGTIAKASTLQGEHQHRFLEAHIATDMRPIFQDDLDAPLAAAMITHMLKLTYSEGGEPKEFFVALNSDDIEELRSVLHRADQKAYSLESLMESAHVPLMGEVE